MNKQRNTLIIPKKITKNLAVQDNIVNLLCSRENLPTILDLLKGIPFKDLNIRNPTLEDIFLEYYKAEPYEKNPNNKKRGEN